ncbi:MAG: carboxypeptidase regulatory-like domain-containing protein [Pirellulales bacterium]
MLAGIGMYGTLAYLISQRTQEFGVRMALGATAGSVMAMVAREGAMLSGIGAAVGMAVALAVAGSLRGLLYGAAPIDSTTVISVASLITLVAVAAGSGVWTDNIYLSRDQVFDPATDTFLGQVSTGVASLMLVDDGGTTYEEYQRTASLRVPSGLTGPFYVFVQVDRGGHIVELGVEGNNNGYDLAPVFVSLAPPIDLVAGEVTVPATASLGATISMTITLHNDGDTIASGWWTDRLYLSTDEQYSPDDVRLTARTHSPVRFPVPDPPVPAHGSQTFDYSTRLPAILPGQYFLVLRTDIFNLVPESNEENNLSVSLDRVSVDVPEIVIDAGVGTQPLDVTLGNQQIRVLYYRFDAVDGQTLSLDANYIDIPDELVFDPDIGQNVLRPVARQSAVSAYLAYGRVPTPFDYDLRQDDLLATLNHFHTEESLVVPRTRAGTYYLRIELRDTHPPHFYNPFEPILGSHEIFDLDVTVLPFQISSLEGNAIGNTGPATTAVVASNFTACTAVELLSSGVAVRSAQHVERLGDDTALVTFDYAGLAAGDYEIRVTDHTGASDVETISIVDGAGSRVGGSITGPSPLRRSSQYVFYATYGNSGDADGVAPLLLLESADTNPWGLAREGQVGQPSLQALGISLEGPAGMLRPGELGSVPVYFTTASGPGGSSPRFLVHTITADDSRPLVFAEIEASIRPETMTDDEWNALRPKIVERLGPTWGSYVRALGETASLLSRRGVRTQDVSIIFRELISELRNPYPVLLNGSVVAASTCGPLADPVVQAVDAQGTIVSVAAGLDNGDFTFFGLPPGVYSLVAEAEGAARTLVSDVVVSNAGTSQTLALPAESSITGEIVPGTGIVADAVITVSARPLSPNADALGSFLARSTNTNFELRGLPAGNYELTFDIFGGETKMQVVSVGVAESLDVSQIDLAALGWVIGSVVSTVGPLANQNARVALLDVDRLVDTSLVDVDGGYVFFSVPPGPYTVRAVDISTSRLVGSAAAVDVLPGEFTEAAELTLGEGAVIGGVVTLVSTSAPVANLPIRLRSASGGLLATATDAAGNYLFNGLESGDYTVSVPGAGAQAAVTVTTLDGTLYPADLAFEPVATLTGRLTRADDSPIADATVRLNQNGEFVLHARTDVDGRYTFLLFAAGTFDVDPVVDGASFFAADSVAVSAGQDIHQDFVAGTAELLVRPQDVGDEPGQVTVLIRQASLDDQAVVGSASVDLASDPAGTVLFSNLVPGEYIVETISGNRCGRATTTLVAGAANEVVIVSDVRRTISGTILDAAGAPLENVTVFAVASDGTSRTNVGFARPDGRYRVPQLEPGAYTLVVQAPGYETQLLDVAAAFDRTVDVTLADATSGVDGRVVDDVGSPVASATLRVVNPDGVIVASGVTAADGSFRVDGVVGDDVSVVVEAVGFGFVQLNDVDAAAGTFVDVGDVTVSPLGIALVVDAVSGSPSPIDGHANAPQPAGSPPIPPGPLVFAVPAVSAIYAALEVFVFDAERSLLEVDPSDVPPELDNCGPCHGHFVATSQAVMAQNQAFAVVEARDNDLDWQAASLPAAIILETAVNAGAIATAVLAIEGILFAAGVSVTVGGVTIGATSAAGQVGLMASASTAVQWEFAIAQTISAVGGMIDIMYFIADTQDLPSLSDAFTNFGSAVSVFLQYVDVLANVTAAIFSNSQYIAQPLQQFGSFWGGTGNIIGLISQLGMLVDTFTYTASRDAYDLIVQAREFRDMAYDSYFAVVLAAGANLGNYLQCIEFYQFHTEYCADDDDDGSGNNPDPNDPSLPFPDLPPSPPPPAPPPGQYYPPFVVSIDPNDILGPAGFGDEKWVTLRDPLAYTIRFENTADASAPAMLVTINQQLDDDLDFRTFRVDDFGFGETQIELNASQPYFQGRVPLADGSPYVVDVIAIIDILTGLVTWVFQTLDPATGEPPLDALAGFLPPNDETHRGEGFVSYTVKPKQSAATGSRADAEATIVFDDNEPIDTPPIFNTLDAAAPSSNVEAVSNPAGTETFNVRWTAGDDAGGSALSAVDVFVSRDGRPFEPWLVATALTEAPYVGALGHTYSFYSVARDNAGNAESLPTTPDATTSVPFPGLFGDLNGDGTVGIADLIRIRNNLGLSGTASHDDGDLTGDRRVNMEDVAAFLAVFGERDGGGGSPAAADAVIVAAPHAPGDATSRRLPAVRNGEALAAPRRAARRAAIVENVDAALATFEVDGSGRAEGRLTARRRASHDVLSSRLRGIAREVDLVFGGEESR